MQYSVLGTVYLVLLPVLYVHSDPVLRRLEAEPGFKEIRLSWAEPLVARRSQLYQLKFCENQVRKKRRHVQNEK